MIRNKGSLHYFLWVTVAVKPNLRRMKSIYALRFISNNESFYRRLNQKSHYW